VADRNTFSNPFSLFVQCLVSHGVLFMSTFTAKKTVTSRCPDESTCNYRMYKILCGKGGGGDFITQEVYFLRLMRVYIGFIMLVACTKPRLPCF
jgi:hypothetical protein